MADLLAVTTWLALASGVGVGLLGLFLLLLRPRRTYTVAFALFLIIWAGVVLAGNLATLKLAAGDSAGATRRILVHVATLTVLYLPLAYFALTYPSRNPLVRRWSFMALLLAPAVLGSIALLVRPDLLYRGFSGAADSGSIWGPLYPLLTGAHVAALLFAIHVFGYACRCAPRQVEQRRSLYVLVGLALYAAFLMASLVASYGLPLVRPDLPDPSGADWALLAIGPPGLAFLIAETWMLRQAPLFQAPRNRVLLAGAVVVPVAVGLLSGYTAVAPGVEPIPAHGLWRFGTAALIAYAVLRYELFDAEVRLKRGALLVAAALPPVLVGVWVVSGASWTSPATPGLVGRLALLAGAIGLLVAAPRFAAYGSRRVLTRLETARHLEGRRLEVYEAALAQGAGAGTISAEDPVLAGLRKRLGITTNEHALLARLVVPPAAAPAGPGRLEPGATVGDRYRLDRLLGEGSSGAAFLATDAALHRPVVLKALRPQRGDDDAALRAFVREARLAARIEHPNVVRVYDFGYWNTTPYLVMEYAEGGSLLNRLEQHGRLGDADALTVTRHALEGLEHIHAQGVLHRDLKPANVLLARDGNWKLADFGIALAAAADDSGDAPVPPGGPAGTPAYMSPEAVLGMPETRRSDVYAAAAMLYHALTGQTYLLLHGRSAGQIRRSILEEPPPEPRTPLPEGLRRELWKALSKEPRDRHASARELLDAIEAAAAPAVTPAGTPEATAPRR